MGKGKENKQRDWEWRIPGAARILHKTMCVGFYLFLVREARNLSKNLW